MSSQLETSLPEGITSCVPVLSKQPELAETLGDISRRKDEEICEFISNLSIKSLPMDESPPIQLLSATVKVLCQEPYRWDRTFDVLDLLAQVELLRRNIVAQAQLAFEVYKYRLGSNGEKTLSKRAKFDVRNVADADTAMMMRKEYHAISFQIRWHHLAHLLICNAPDEFRTVLDKYFPADEQNAPQDNLYSLLLSEESEEDADDEIDPRKYFENLQIDAKVWRERREAWFKKQWPNVPLPILYGEQEFMSYRREFLAAFEPDQPLKKLLLKTRQWATKVELFITTIESHFPPEGGPKEEADMST